MAVIDGEDIVGSFVRRIGYQSDIVEEKLLVACVKDMGTLNETLLEKVFTISKTHLVEVEESSELRKQGKRQALALRKQLNL